MRRLLRLVTPAMLMMSSGVVALAVPRTTRAQTSVPQVERPIAFDAAGRVLVLTPTVASRWKLGTPYWPLGGD